MEPTPMNQEPVAASPAPAKASYGTIVALVVIVAALAVAASYLFDTRLDAKNGDADLKALEAQSDSTDPNAIQADLSAQSSEDFDKSIDSAYAGMDASFDAQ